MSFGNFEVEGGGGDGLVYSIFIFLDLVCVDFFIFRWWGCTQFLERERRQRCTLTHRRGNNRVVGYVFSEQISSTLSSCSSGFQLGYIDSVILYTNLERDSDKQRV